MSEEKGKAKRALILKIVLSALAFAAVATAALLGYFLPLEKLQPASGFAARVDGELRIHFLSVGQADCTVVEFPEGDLLVIDAGDGSYFSRKKIAAYLKGLNPTSLELLITHADVDHYGGAENLIATFGAEKVYLPLLGSEAEEYLSLLSAIGERGIPTETLSRYDVLSRPSGAYLVCLSPYSVGESDSNDSSTVLYLNYGGVRAVFCGDISAAREKLLVREYSLAEGLFDSGEYTVRLNGIDILKAAHHGSAGSSSQEWLDLLRPASLVVSSGVDNGYDHPSGEALARFRSASPKGEVYRTDELGDVVVSVKAGGYTFLTDTE